MATILRILPRCLFHAASALFLFLALSVSAGSNAEAKSKTHTVAGGQRLGSIAKRYNVSIDDLCKANGITRRSTIRPGQKLVIPGTDDGATKKTSRSKEGDQADAPPRPQGKTRTHVVTKGHTISAVAGRYAITVTSLCRANGINRNASLRVGQKLIIPHKTDKGGEYANKQRLRGDFDERRTHSPKDESKTEKGKKGKPRKINSWDKYVKPAWRRGYIKMRRYGRYWEGYVIGPKNQVLGHASNKINFVLGARSDGPRIAPKLIRLISSVSDKFGGRELRIVSGYRTKSFVAASKHKEGKALDFSIPGVPNDVLRDYLRTLDDVGVGYYPNSSFVHVDVRGYNSYWVDHAGPGQAPRLAKKSTKKRPTASPPAASSGDDAPTEPAAPSRTTDERRKKPDAPAQTKPVGKERPPAKTRSTPVKKTPPAPSKPVGKERPPAKTRGTTAN